MFTGDLEGRLEGWRRIHWFGFGRIEGFFMIWIQGEDMMLLISHWLFLLWDFLIIFKLSMFAFSGEVFFFVMFICLKQECLDSG